MTPLLVTKTILATREVRLSTFLTLCLILAELAPLLVSLTSRILAAHNSAGGYGDLNVDANDVSEFLAEFGRSNFYRTMSEL